MANRLKATVDAAEQPVDRDEAERARRDAERQRNERINAEARALLDAEAEAVRQADERSPILEPMRTKAATNADAILDRFFTKNGFLQLVFYRENWYANYKRRWSLRSDQSISHYLDDRLRRCRIVKVTEEDGRTLEDFPVSTATVTEIKNRIKDRVTISDELTAPLRRDGDKWVQIDTTGKAIFRNQIVDILSGEVVSAEGVFYPGGADFDYDPAATSPSWDAFMDQIFESHEEDRVLIAQWAGYILAGSTRHQKAMLIEGPPRAGKGLVGQIMTELIGEDLCAFPTLQDLSQPFGLQQLLDKRLLLSSDVRLSSRTDSMAVIEKILKITGNDKLSVGKKYTNAVQTKLDVRVMLLTNSLPRMTDDTQAFFSRFLIIRLHKSFLGAEDTTLLNKFKDELPGIANWAMQGYRDLVANGAFSEPQSSKDISKDWYKNSNPLEQFIDESCKVVDINNDNFESSDAIFASYKYWAEKENLQKVLTKNWLIRHLTRTLGDKVEVGEHSKQNVRGLYGLKVQKPPF
jgi:putative DNA primase/helicase